VKNFTFINLLILIFFTLAYSGITSEYVSIAEASDSASFKINKLLTASDFNDADIPFIASHFNIIDTYLGKAKQIQKIKKLNPPFRAIYYKNALTHRAGAIEGWYVHDAQTGSRLVNKNWGWYLMDIGNASYRTSLAHRIKNDLDANPVFDGVFLDDVWPRATSGGSFVREGTADPGVLPQSVIDSWQVSMRLLLGEVKASIGKRLLIINTGVYIDYFTLADGQMYEAFCHANWQPFREHSSDWQKGLERMIVANNLEKIYLAQSGIIDGATNSQIRMISRYCFAMFLLGANERSFFYFKPSMKYQGVTYFPEWDIDIGNPIEDYHARAGTPLFEREYSKALVLINPSSESVQTNLGGKYKNLDGIIANTIVLGSHEGEILLKCPEDLVK